MQNKILKLNSFSYLLINPVKKIENKKKIVEIKQRMLMFKAFRKILFSIESWNIFNLKNKNKKREKKLKFCLKK